MFSIAPYIIAETKQYLVINKPSGIVVEKSPYYASIETAVYDYLHAMSPKQIPYVGIVHRLDRAVSGVLLIAKKKSYLKAFNQQFEQRQVQKTYQALVSPAPLVTEATLKHYHSVDKINKKAIIKNAVFPNSTKVSLAYQTLQHDAHQAHLAIDLHSGKFHQIRAQLAAIGSPIIGDSKYGSTIAYHNQSIALHATRLVVFEPTTQEKLVFESVPAFML